MVENFHRIGKYEGLKTELKICERWIRAFLSRHLATSAVIKSNPGDFLMEYLLIVNLISFGEKCLTGWFPKRNGDPRYSLTAILFVWDKMSGWGLNVLERCTLNNSALSESVMT